MSNDEDGGFLDSTAGKVVVGLLIAAVAIGVLWYLKSAAGPSDAAKFANEKTFIDSKTGKAFKVTLEAGMKVPVKAPSGEMSGYPAELCYWTADGQVKSTADAVLLNLYLGKSDPTFCPVCGRLVQPRSEKPASGARPPPTQAEYAARHAVPTDRADDR